MVEINFRFYKRKFKIEFTKFFDFTILILKALKNTKRLKLDIQDKNSLILEKNKLVHLKEIIIAFFAFIFLIVYFILLSDKVLPEDEYIFVAIPVVGFFLYSVFTAIKKNIKLYQTGEIIYFDKSLDKIFIGSLEHGLISDVLDVELEFEEGNEKYPFGYCYLIVYFKNSQALEIDHSVNFKESKNIGQIIAKFLDKPFEIRSNGRTESERKEENGQDREILIKEFEEKYKIKSTEELTEIVNSYDYTYFAKDAAKQLLKKRL